MRCPPPQAAAPPPSDTAGGAAGPSPMDLGREPEPLPTRGGAAGGPSEVDAVGDGGGVRAIASAVSSLPPAFVAAVAARMFASAVAAGLQLAALGEVASRTGAAAAGELAFLRCGGAA
jgi:hypothetical protein